MKFLRYLCWYCLSRFTYDSLRRVLRRPPTKLKPHDHHAWHVVLSLVLWLCAIAFLTALLAR